MAMKKPDEKAVKERTFAIRKLRENCFDVLGVPLSTFDGAFAGRSGSVTLEQAKAILTEWENRKFPVGPMEVK